MHRILSLLNFLFYVYDFLEFSNNNKTNRKYFGAQVNSRLVNNKSLNVLARTKFLLHYQIKYVHKETKRTVSEARKKKILASIGHSKFQKIYFRV